MNGTGHYLEAERLLESITNVTVPAVQGQGVLAAAQVHAILALVDAVVSASPQVSAAAIGKAVSEAVNGAATAAPRPRPPDRPSPLPDPVVPTP